MKEIELMSRQGLIANRPTFLEGNGDTTGLNQFNDGILSKLIQSSMIHLYALACATIRTGALDRIIQQQQLTLITPEQARARYFEERIEKARVFMEKLESQVDLRATRVKREREGIEPERLRTSGFNCFIAFY